MPNFMHNYLIFDEFGMQAILCMACAKPIKTRMEVLSQLDNGVIRELAKHADYREIPVMLENGKLAFIMVCDDCKFVPINEEEAKCISMQIHNALRSQLEHEGKLPDLIDAILKEQSHTVLRKAEVAEVTAALRGA